jgi:retinol-binding protein 3
MIRSRFFLAATLLLVPLPPAARQQVVEHVAQLLETMYVVPAMGTALAAKVRTAAAHGAYGAEATASALTEALNRDLAEANDGHLSVRFRSDDADAAPMEDERRANHGFRNIERFEGNVGYLDLGGFMSGDEARAVATGAMAFLAGSDAVVIDLRRCPGGSPEAVSYLASYFFGPEKRVLMKRFNRPSNTTSESTTVDVKGRLMPGIPLYLLIGGGSASACESFAYTLQQYGRAKLVGERTAGAGYNNEIVPLGHGMNLSVSVGTATHPRSGKGWQAVGVQPDIAVPADRAFSAARADALKTLIEKPGINERRKRELSIALETLEPAPPPAAAGVSSLADFAGTYGNKAISVRDGGLYYQRIGGRGATLAPLEGDRFALSTDAVITFRRDAAGTVTTMRIEWTDRPLEELNRERPATPTAPTRPPG